MGGLASEGELSAPALGLTAAAIFVDHAARVWRILRYLGVPESDLPDASQDVFLVVHRRIGDFEGSSKVETWLYGICLRVASNRRRRAKRKPTTALPEQELPAEEGGEARREARELLLLGLAQLDESQRNMLVLAEIEEIPMKEVARLIGCPLFTAYSRRRAAKKALKRALEAIEAGHG